MRRYPVFLLVLMSLPLLQTGLYSFEWPVKPERVVAGFGEYRSGSFLKGLEIETRDKDVRAIEAGKLIYFAEETPRHNGALPSGIGNSMVVEHERGIRSVYGYLSGIPGELNERMLKKDEKLPVSGGQTGKEGRAEDDTRLVYLKILDSELDHAVNPLLSLPSVEDTRDVEIESVALVPAGSMDGRAAGGTNGSSAESAAANTSARAPLRLDENSSVEAGEYEIHIEAFDSYVLENRTGPLAPFSFRVYINGEEELNIRFEYITAEGLSHTLEGTGGKRASDLYKDKWRYCPGIIRLNPGDALIEVVVSDIAGNETTETYRLSIR